MISILADSNVSSDLNGWIKLVVEGGVFGGVLYWLASKLIPRLQDDLDKSRDAFSASLREERKEFIDALKEERESAEKTRGAVLELADCVKNLSFILNEHKDWTTEAIRQLKEALNKG